MYEQNPQPGEPYQPHPNQSTGPVYLPPTPPKKRKTWLVAAAVSAVVLVGLCGVITLVSIAIGGEQAVEAPAAEPSDNGMFDRESEQRGEPAAEPATPEPQPEPQPEPESELTVSQEQAVISAESYLRNLGGFSRSGLVDQLEYEGFSEEDAEFAVDYLDPDWKEQAVISAESYMDMGGFSRESLIDQLEYEGFTRKQAEHGADEVGL